MGKYTRAVTRQPLGKDVPAAIDTKTTMVYEQRNGVSFGPRRVVCYATER
jgi:hypothetical protein